MAADWFHRPREHQTQFSTGAKPQVPSPACLQNQLSTGLLTKAPILCRYSLSRTTCKPTCRDAVRGALFKGRKETAWAAKRPLTVINGPPSSRETGCPAGPRLRLLLFPYLAPWSRYVSHLLISLQLLHRKRWEAC